MEVTEDLIASDNDRSTFNGLNTDKTIGLNFMTLLDAHVIIKPCTKNAIVATLSNPAHLDSAITSEALLGYRKDSVLPAVLDR